MPASSVLLNAPPTTTSKRALLCRACGSASLRTFFSLGDQPLANRFLTEAELTEPEPRFPLALQRCHSCTLIQLTHVVEPDLLYAGYKFASGVSLGWERHCAELLDGRRPGRLLDLASNDGTLVRVATALGWDALGVEPAPIGDYPVLRDYWPAALPRLVGTYDLITAQNVVGHVDDVLGFLKGCTQALAPGGRVMIECPDTLRTLEATQYDQVYHEHLSYWTLLPLWTLALRAGLDVVHVESLALHGGSLRYWLMRRTDTSTPSHPVTKRLQHERLSQRVDGPRRTRQFAIRANGALNQCARTLEELAGQRVWACGASAKSTVVLNALKERNAVLPSAVLDDSPLKQGLYTPGTHLPVLPFQNLSHVQAILLTAWNWADAMKARCAEHGFTGRYVLPHE